MKILLIGYGKMGRLIASTAEAAGDEIVGVFHRENLGALENTGKIADVVIDFSQPSALPAVEEYIRRTCTALVSGTTGYSAEELARVRALGDCAPVLWAANYSIGVAVFRRALAEVAAVLKPDFDIEMTETHHNQKADAPSGTAKLLLSAMDPEGEYTPVYGREGACGKRGKKEIGVFALRGGTVAGTHTVHFFGPDEELEFTHRAASRQIFVNGALNMARRMAGKPNGSYDLETLLFGE